MYLDMHAKLQLTFTASSLTIDAFCDDSEAVTVEGAVTVETILSLLP